MSRLIGSFLIDDNNSEISSRSIFVAENTFDLTKVGKLRYSLYVARDRKAYPCANHEDACFIEPIDSESLNLFGVAQDSCVTTMRITKAHIAVEDEYLNRLLVNSRFDNSSYHQLMVASRLATSPSAESRNLMLCTIRESYRIAIRNGIAFVVAATRTSLLPFFKRLGFVPSGQTYIETIAGEMNVVLLDMYNRKHLESVHSPFVDLLDGFESEQMAGAFA